MRILRVIASANPEDGGPIHGLIGSSAGMARLGHATEVLTLDDPKAPYLRQFPFKVHALGCRRSRYGYTKALVPWIRKNAAEFDVIVLHGLWNYTSLGAWRGLGSSGAPYVIFTHGMLDPWFNKTQPIKRWAKQLYWFLWEGKVLRDARAVLFTSEEERLRARRSFIGYHYREHVVAYGAFDPPAAHSSSTFRQRLPYQGNRPYLLYLGRLHPKKGGDMLVEAFCGLADRFPDIDLVMAGPDSDGFSEKLARFAASQGKARRIIWPGMLQGAEKWEALSRAEALILPSHQENFGLVVAEALAMGTPVLISDKVNIWREVQAFGAGLVEADTLDGTRRLLDRFLAMDDAERADMRTAALEVYRRHFSIEGASASLLALLQETARLPRDVDI